MADISATSWIPVKYLGRMIAMDNIDNQAICTNMKKASKGWARISPVLILRADNASPRVYGMFYKVTVQGGSNPGWIIFVQLPYIGIPIWVESKLCEISASVRSQQQHHEIFLPPPAKHCSPWTYKTNSNAVALPPYSQHPPLSVRLQKQ